MIMLKCLQGISFSETLMEEHALCAEYIQVIQCNLEIFGAASRASSHETC